MAAKTSNKYNYDVAIDAGHGSNTAGKRTPDGYREHYINVMVSYYEEQYLKSRGLKCLRVGWDDLNSKDDTDVSLTRRQKRIKNAKCRVVSSNHANAYGADWNQANGVESLVHITKAKRGDSVALATAVQAQLVKGTKQTNRGVKYQSLAMCNCTAMGCEAAVLSEIGFMTNKYEAGLMKTDVFCKEQGEDIARGVLAYLGVADKAVTSSTSGSSAVKTLSSSSSFKSYKVKVTAKTLNVRAGAGTKYKVVTTVKKDYQYTIVEEKKNGSTTWGKLKSGAGWISLQYTKKV